MVDRELPLKTLVELADLLRSKKVSPVELVQVYLERIERVDGKVRAYITVCGEEALAAAKVAEREILRGIDNGPLHGVPVAVKDQFDTQGILTTMGSLIYSDYIPQEDATVVARLKQAGAILLGKLNLTEFAFGDTREYRYGTPRNPWDLDRSPGMSSAGSGIAVAASLSAGALGEDTGGSVRLPAAMCGVVGLRPTYRRVSRHGVFPMCWSMDTPGPMTKTVEDCALMLGIIAGHDPKDRISSTLPVPDYTCNLGEGVKGMRVGYIREQVEALENDREIQQAVMRALKVLEGLGARVEPVSIPLVSLAGPIYIAVCDSDAAGAHETLLRRRARDYDAATRARLLTASLLPATLYHRAQRARELLRRQMLQALEGVEVLVSPVTATPPPTISETTRPFESEEDVRVRLFGARAHTTPYSLAGLPAISIPCGFTSWELPIGLQIGGRAFDEETVLRAAAAYQGATHWHTRRPKV
ncbi:MAG: amidase [Dehalococcoidia bacterium]